MFHKACFHCNLLFEATPDLVGVSVPCPNCGQPLEDHQVTQETVLEEPVNATTMWQVPGGKSSTTMFRLPEAERRASYSGSMDVLPPDPDLDVPTQAFKVGALGPTLDSDFDRAAQALTPATRSRLEMEDAPTRALDARALRTAVTGGAPSPQRQEDMPTRALDARRLAAGPPEDPEDTPTTALDAHALRAAVMTPATPSAHREHRSPAPGRGVRGVSGPVPKRRARPAPPKPAPHAPVPQRHSGPVQPSVRHSAPVPGAPSGPVPQRRRPPNPATPSAEDRPRRSTRPDPVPEPRRGATRAERAPPPPAADAGRHGATRMEAEPPPPEPTPDYGGQFSSYFDQSRAIDVPDALGALISAPAPGPAPVAERSTTMPPRSKPKRSKGRLYLVLAGVVVVIVGAIALVATRDTDPAGTVAEGSPPSADAPVEAPKWREAFQAALTKARVRLPASTQGDPLDEAPYVIAGPDGVSTDQGPVVGLMSTPIPDSAVERDENGEAVRPLLNAFGRAKEDRITVALDRRTTARTAARVLHSAKKSGFRRFGLLARRGGDTDGELVTLEVSPFRLGTPLPAAGGVVLRVGRLGINGVVQGRDGRVMGERPAPLPRAANGSLDFDALDGLLDQLSSKHPRVRDAVVYVNGDLPLEPLMGVLARVRGSERRDRFPSISLSVQ